MTDLSVSGRTYAIYPVAEDTAHLPLTIAVLLENLLRHGASSEQVDALRNWSPDRGGCEIDFYPARVLMQDFTGVPCMVDLATIRQEVVALGGDPALVNPLIPTDLVIDHSVIADEFGQACSFEHNRELEFERNAERYRFLKWSQQAFDNLRIVPPDTGIVHQVNIEYLANVVVDKDGVAYPDTCIGTDSHTTMVNGLGVLGWGVGGIEAEAAMLGQPVSMTTPQVTGVRLIGRLPAGVTSTDLVLTIAERLRVHGVVGRFVEFFGPSVGELRVETRCTIANMSPEYGSTACLFPIDSRTIDYLRLTGRTKDKVELVEAYAKAQGLWLDPDRQTLYSQTLTIDLSEVEPSIAGPKRPQDRISLTDAKRGFESAREAQLPGPDEVATQSGTVPAGAIGIAAITSCTNTSNPEVMVAAGLVAAKAVERGLEVPWWVKTTLSPGSQVATDYLDAAGLTQPLQKLGFFTVGYGCVTCIGNSGPLVPDLSQAIGEGLIGAAVLSGNRNFEGRINQELRMNYLASPPLVVAYALAGTMDIDLTTEPIGVGTSGPVYLKDVWPSDEEIADAVAAYVNPAMYATRNSQILTGSTLWETLPSGNESVYTWPDSTYIRKAPYLDSLRSEPDPLDDIDHARVLLVLGDSVTTDHISPAGVIPVDSPAGVYLSSLGVARKDFNSYGSRRGNHEVMMRGTFANPRLKNQIVAGIDGGYTRDFTRHDAPVVTVFEADEHYRDMGIPLVIIAGKEYGTGSSRDWAAKGTALLGVKAVIAQSFERIHRSNLVGMGVIPLEFLDGQSASTLGLTGEEEICVYGLGEKPLPSTAVVTAQSPIRRVEFEVKIRVDTAAEHEYLRNGGILPYVTRRLVR